MSDACLAVVELATELIRQQARRRRDFIHASDIAHANLLALKNDAANGGTYNAGTDHATTVLEVINLISVRLGARETPDVADRYRAGDIRHCFADISRIKADLGFVPQMSLEDRIADLMTWLQSRPSTDSMRTAVEDLVEHVLIH